MENNDLRSIALSVASMHDVPRTIALISDVNSNFVDILKTAADEAGMDKLIPVILENDPNWALNALRHLPNLGEYEQPLIKKASELLDRMTPALFADADGNPPQLQKINKLELYLDGAASFTAYFTMFWFTPPFSGPGDWKPGVANAGSFKESDMVDDYGMEAKECSFFSINTSTLKIPVNTGDQVTMICNITANGSWTNTGFFFIYDPAATITARITATGLCGSPSFTFNYMTSTSS